MSFCYQVAILLISNAHIRAKARKGSQKKSINNRIVNYPQTMQGKLTILNSTGSRTVKD